MIVTGQVTSKPKRESISIFISKETVSVKIIVGTLSETSVIVFSIFCVREIKAFVRHGGVFLLTTKTIQKSALSEGGNRSLKMMLYLNYSQKIKAYLTWDNHSRL